MRYRDGSSASKDVKGVSNTMILKSIGWGFNRGLGSEL